MRFAKSSRTLFPLALTAVLATCALAQEHPNVQPNAVRDQLANQTPAPPQAQSAPQPPPPKPGPSPAKGPTPTAPKAPVKTPAPGPGTTVAKPPAPAKAPVNEPARPQAKAPEPAKTPAKAPAAAKGPAKAAASSPAKPPAGKPVEEKVSFVRRDPFDTLLNKGHAAGPPENLPPGKAGLIIATLRINGIVRSSNGMIAIVSNSQQRVYFLREGDKLYDGAVDKITLDAISFREFGKDAFGKPLERLVTKRLYPSPGEQQ